MTSADSLPEAQKSNHGFYINMQVWQFEMNTYMLLSSLQHGDLYLLHATFPIQQYAELQSANVVEEKQYWVPAATLSGIKAQICHKSTHSFEL